MKNYKYYKIEKTEKSSQRKKNQNKKSKDEKVVADNVVQDRVVVPLPLDVIRYIYRVLLTANSRCHWQPDELIPVGRVIQDISNIIRHYETDVPDNNSSGSTSSASNST